MKTYKQLNNGIKIIEYTPDHAQGISDMWVKCSGDWGGDAGIRTPSQIIAEHSGAANFNVFLALDGDIVVGYCSFARYYYDANTTYIPTLTVRPDYQGKGIGKALVLLCVERTIELGYPQTDLYTWAGNTAAVPLYKKCGYLWEDRPNSTHLTNFMPTVLKLFPEFFAKADWYKDSTRVIEVKPDGEMVNEFECFGYSWAKDDEMLAVGFERSGKKIRMVETQDYKIEFMAENHKLAYGLDYDCYFTVENKTGKPLHIEIIGKQDGNITFNHEGDSDIGPGNTTIKGRFHVGPIAEPQDLWRVHPCLRADVTINETTTIPFGLGIESCFPLAVDLHDECQVSQVGITKDCYINIESTLPQDATIQFTLPDNPLLAFASKTHTVQVEKRAKASIKIPATILGIGYHPLPITYSITLKDGTHFIFEKHLHIANQDLAHGFSYEDDLIWGIANGPWKMEHSKQDNDVSLYHILDVHPGEFALEPPKFGKPYDDEFNLIKPTVRSYQKGPEMVMEAEYESNKFPKMALTQIITLTASGKITRHYRVENRGTTPTSLMLCDPSWIPLWLYSRFHYQGKIATTMDGPWADGTPSSLEDIDLELFGENWIFEDEPSITRGICWPIDYKPAIKWGNHLSFEIELGEVAPGQIFETKPVVTAYGMFTQANDFRNYAMGLYNRKPLDMEYPMEVKANGYNPFITGDKITLELVNNRSTILEGDIKVDSPDGIFAPQTQTNEDNGEITKRNTFELALSSSSDGMALARLSMDLTQYQKTYNRTLFFPSGEITSSMDGDVYEVSNGRLTIKASPAYSNALFSMATTGPDGTQVEWLESRYPNHEPYAWYNPFIGGIQMRPQDMNPMTVIKEKVSANFVKHPDNHGNIWQGICTTMAVTEFEKLRGAVYESYYMTLPGLPIVCSFFRFINKTGVFKESIESTKANLRVSDKLTDVFIECTDKNLRQYRQRAGVAWQQAGFANVVKLSGTRPEKLYVFHGNKMTPGGNNRADWENKMLEVYIDHPIGVAHGEAYISRPVFFLVTDSDLPEGALDDLERVVFE